MLKLYHIYPNYATPVALVAPSILFEPELFIVTVIPEFLLIAAPFPPAAPPQ